MTGPQRNPPGIAGQNFIANVDRLRQVRNLSYDSLAAKLGDIGHPINPVSLSRLGRGERRVSVDDLIAFARVLGTEPLELLQPLDAAQPAPGDIDLDRLADMVAERVIGRLAAAMAG
jgi:transcriptional regulator with XRE-family HTH domain